MPMQEFLATYAVRVDEDGARRLRRILEQNREAGAQLTSVFSAAREALEQLKKELSDSAGVPNPLNARAPPPSGCLQVSAALLAPAPGSRELPPCPGSWELPEPLDPPPCRQAQVSAFLRTSPA